MTFIGILKASTDRAYFFQDWFWHGAEWMPKSQVQVYSEPDTFEVRLDASDWITKQKKLTEFQERTQEEIDANAKRD